MSELVRYTPEGPLHRKTSVQIDRKNAQNLGTGLTEGFVQRVRVTIGGGTKIRHARYSWQKKFLTIQDSHQKKGKKRLVKY